MQHEHYFKTFLENNRYPRELKHFERIQGASHYLMYQGKRVIDFSSSDYLGLTQHPHLIETSCAFAKRYGVGTASSRLVTGNLDCFEIVEEKLAAFLKKPAALIFSSGYQTNMGVLEALFQDKKPHVFADKYAHASMLNITQHVSQLHRFHHNDMTSLERLLKKYASDTPSFILVESLYSMEGDVADLKTISQLAKQYNAFLYVDDAHAFGVYGENGEGLAVAYNADMIMGTFSKALGSLGGYVVCSDVTKRYLVNKCKSLIYSTGLSPMILGAIYAALDVLPTLSDARKKLQQYTEQVRAFFSENELDCGNSQTHIIPWIIGDETKTRHISQQLLEAGIIATAIQPPSVPIHKSRIRFCLSAAHTEEDIDYLLQILKKYV